MNEKTYVILKRFAKGIIGGAVAQMMLVSINQPSIWSDFTSILNQLGIACAFGSMTGLLLALQKWASWQE